MTINETNEHQNSLFGDIEIPNPTPKPKRGKSQPHKIIEIDPTNCTVWDGNPRNKERVDNQELQELVDSIASVGQTVPVVARLLSEHRYEIIVGCRRWLAAREIQKEDSSYMLRAEVRSLNDEEAFTLVQSENTGRRALSVFETAQMVYQALTLHYDASQVDLANRIGKSTTWVSRYVQIASNLSIYFELFPNWNDISFRQASSLADYAEKHPEQARTSFEAIRDSDQKFTNTDILNRVVKHLSATPKSRVKTKYGPSKKPHLVVNKHSKSRLVISIPKYDSMNNEAIESSFKSCLTEWQKE